LCCFDLRASEPEASALGGSPARQFILTFRLLRPNLVCVLCRLSFIFILEASMEVQFLIGVMGTFTVVATYYWVGREKQVATNFDVAANFDVE
jgi:hypothetical protein